MNSNKTSLKSQLIRLGLVVPLALVSVGAYATAATEAQLADAAANDKLVDAAEYGKEKDQETDFSSDPFAKPKDTADDDKDVSGDDLAARKLSGALIAGDTALNAHFVAGHEAGRDLLDFNPAGVSDGVLSVQAGLGSSSIIFAETAVAASAKVEAVAPVAADSTTTPPTAAVQEVIAKPEIVGRAAGTLADLTVSAKKVVLGTGFASSLNGSDKLVIGGFGGYGALGFASKLHEVELEDDATDAEKKAAEKAQKNYLASVAAKSSGFGGGVFATYQADETSPLGFSAGAKIRYTELTHLLTKKAVEDVVVDAGTTNATTDDIKARKIKKTYYGYKNGAVNADLNVGYALEVAKVAGLPIIVKASAKVVADYDKFEQGIEDDQSKGILLLDKRFGLTLSTVLLDGKLSPSVTLGLSQANAIQAQSDGFATIPVPENKTDFTKTIGAGLQYAFSDNIALTAGFQKVLVPAKEKDAKDKAGDLLNQSGGEFGLVYRF